MSKLKVFIACNLTQGQRKSDFCFTNAGELVTFGSECDRDHSNIDGSCGCRRSLIGVASHKATTTFLCVYKKMTRDDFVKAIKKMWVDGGWGKFLDDDELQAMAQEDADEILRVASHCKAGDVCEKRGDVFRIRTSLKKGS